MSDRISMIVIIFVLFASLCNIFAAESLPDEPNGLADLVKEDKWGEPNNGLVTQLIPQSTEFVVGKPMKFGLVLKNISDSEKRYDHLALSFKPLIIKSIDNNNPYDKIGLFQPAGGGPPLKIKKGEIVTLFENQDISKEYVIIKPGKYTIQFRGGPSETRESMLPSSNIVEFKVNPGTPDERDLLISSLINILPDTRWWLVSPQRLRNAPAGRKEEAISIILRYYLPNRYGGINIILWQTKKPAQVVEQDKNAKISDYLGKNDKGYFYIEIPPEALEYWPTIKEEIKKALKIEDQSEQKP